MGIIKSWSFSAKQEYDTCPYKFHHRLVLKTKKPEIPDDSPLKRGLEFHKKAEIYFKEGGPLPDELKQLEELFLETKMQTEKLPHAIEEPWAFTKDWEPTDWDADEAWLRMALDLQIGLDSEETKIIDFKTGKKDGNELKHMLQGQLYAVGALAKNPDLQESTIEFWYLDLGVKTKKVWRRPQIEKLKDRWTKIGNKITSAETLPPKPSKWGCKFCDYKHTCDYAIKEEDL